MAQSVKASQYKKHVRDHDPVYLVRRLSLGLAGWLAFIDVGWRHKILTEYYLYPPLFEMALGRKWMIRPQRPLIRDGAKKGSPETVDFAMLKNGRTIKRALKGRAVTTSIPRALAVLELKLAKTKQRFPTTYVGDCRKLGRIAPASISYESYEIFKCFLMIVGKAENVEHLASRDVKSAKDKSRQRLIEQLRKVFSQDAGVLTDEGWYYDSVGASSSGRYRVAVMLRQDWWEQIDLLPERKARRSSKGTPARTKS